MRTTNLVSVDTLRERERELHSIKMKSKEVLR